MHVKLHNLLFNYLLRYKSDSVCHSLCADLRESIGLECSPEIFTTNASESINAMKRKVNLSGLSSMSK